MSGISLVKNIGASGSNDGSATSLTITVPAGGVARQNLVVVRFAAWNWVNGGSVTVADSRGNSYQQDFGQISFSVGANVLWSSVLDTALVAGDSITISFPSGNQNYAAAADEFSGVHPVSWLWQLGTSATASNTTPSASITPNASPPAYALVLGTMFLTALASDSYTEDGDTAGGDSWHTLTPSFSPLSGSKNQAVRGSYKIPSDTSAAQTWNPVLGVTRSWIEFLAIYRGGVDVTLTDRPEGARSGSPVATVDAIVFGPKTLTDDVPHGAREGEPAAAIGNTVTNDAPAGALSGDPASAIGNALQDKPCGTRTGAPADQLIIDVILGTDRPQASRAGAPPAAIGNTVTNDRPGYVLAGGPDSTLTGNGALPLPPSTLNDELPNPFRPVVLISADFTEGPPGRLENDHYQLSLNSPARRNIVRKFSTNRGRQYELDQVQAGTATLDITDPLELLNPQNTGSPYMQDGNQIKPYRQARIQALWPTEGNIINVAVSWYDPAFVFGEGEWWAPAFSSDANWTDVDPWDGEGCLHVEQGGEGRQYGATNSFDLPPGLRVTFSAYVYPITGPVQIQVVDAAGEVHSSNVATALNTWTRIWVSWKVVDTGEPIWIYGVDAEEAEFRVDGTQLEFGPTPSDFTQYGPVPYDLFQGYIERFPLQYDHHGVRGIRPLTLVDALAILSRTEIKQSYDATVLADNPSVYLPLSNSSVPSTSVELGRGTVGELRHHTGTNGSITWGGDTHPDGTPAVVVAQQNALDPPGGGWNDTQWSFLEVTRGPISMDLSNGATIEFWAKVPAGVVEIGGVGVFDLSESTIYPVDVGPNRPYINVHVQAGKLMFFYNKSGLVGTNFVSEALWPDSEWHYFALTFENDNWETFLDGQYVGSYNIPAPATNLGATVIAHVSAVTAFGDPQSQVSFGRWAFYPRRLSFSELSSHYQRGVGHKGERSGERVERLLEQYWSDDWDDYNVQAGFARMSADFDVSGRMVLDVLQEIQETERGLLYTTKEGVVVFEDREGRYRTQTSRCTFGEDADAGELPYVDYSGDFDPTYVFSQANLTRPDNSDFPPVVNQAVQQDYGQRILSHTMQVDSDFQLREAATFFLHRYAETRIRIDKLVLDPVTNPDLWPIVLSLEISDRVTVKRRAGGFVTSGDYYVEQVNHDVDAEAGSWRVELQLSPVFVPSAWVLGDATRGVLGTTTTPIY